MTPSSPTPVDLAAHTTFALQARCERWIDFDSEQSLREALASIHPGCPVMVIGAGSNMLFTADWPGVILHSTISHIHVIRFKNNVVTVEAGSGVTMDALIHHLCDQGIWGLENLSGIPGEVGASAVQNVGAYGVEAGDLILRVTAYDRVENKTVELTAADCHFAYRDSIFKHSPAKGRYIILSVIYGLSSEPKPVTGYPALAKLFADCPPASPSEVREAVIAIRESKLPDPMIVPSAGSFFKNPVVDEHTFRRIRHHHRDVPHYEVEGGYKIPAAWLIEQCGWKGFDNGRVAVWHKQPLVITNPNRQATAADVLALEHDIIDSVSKKFGVILTPEVEHIAPPEC